MAVFDVISPHSILSLPRASAPRISLSTYHAARPCSIGLMWQPSSSTSTVYLHQSCPLPLCPMSCLCPPPCPCPLLSVSRGLVSLEQFVPGPSRYCGGRLGVRVLLYPAPWRLMRSIAGWGQPLAGRLLRFRDLPRAFACEYRTCDRPRASPELAPRWPRDCGSSAFGSTAWARSDFGQC